MNPRLFLLVLVLVIPNLASRAAAQCAPGSEGSCYEPHETAGCWTTECCDVVCEYDIFCCDESWDQSCVDWALKVCDGFACPGYQPCDDISPEPGCDDQDCCRLVCDHDWFCCYIEWDEFCVANQQALCGIVPCELAIPEGTPDEGEYCYERVNEGCNNPDREFVSLGCGQSVTGTTTTDTPRDTDWYTIELDSETTVTWHIQSEFPAQVVLVSGPCEGPMQAVQLVESNDCGDLVLQQRLEAGVHRVVISPGQVFAPLRDGLYCNLEDPKDPPKDPPETSWFGLRYLVSVSCESHGVPGDLDGDGRVNGSDLLVVLSWWGSDDELADVDGNGFVDGGDILVILGAWTG
jgi:hypothetical protein